MRTMWRASRWAASAIWCRQLVPQAASSVSVAAARIFGNTPNSPIFTDTSKCSASRPNEPAMPQQVESKLSTLSSGIRRNASAAAPAVLNAFW